MKLTILSATAAASALVAGTQGAMAQSQMIRGEDQEAQTRQVTALPSAFGEVRSIDGSGNNLGAPQMGAVDAQLVRTAPNDYDDNVSSMRMTGLSSAPMISARAVSNIVVDQAGADIPNKFGTSDWIWQFGQFLDHDLDLSDGLEEPADIALPAGDILDNGSHVIGFRRAIFDHASGTGAGNPREQINQITAWIDGSNVYGSSQARSDELRSHVGGRLKTSAGDLLPFNVNGFPNAQGPAPDPSALFLAGDVRVNEQVGLAAIHTLFMREHNRLADEIAAANPSYTDEEIFQKARRLVGAELQVITYNEFLPALLGSYGSLGKYKGYNHAADAGIRNEFSVAAYRFGHSALSPNLRRLGANGQSIGDLGLRDVFFNAPSILTAQDSLDPIFRGLSAQKHQAIDSKIVDDLRNFLFGPPGAGGLDLASLNIQRGRDHGVPGLNDVRAALGLKRYNAFSDVTSDKPTRNKLASAYATVDDIDLWVGGLSENPLKSSQLGETFTKILVAQFAALRDGDRFWYERYLTPAELASVKYVKLSDVIMRNTGAVVQQNVFFVPK